MEETSAYCHWSPVFRYGWQYLLVSLMASEEADLIDGVTVSLRTSTYLN